MSCMLYASGSSRPRAIERFVLSLRPMESSDGDRSIPGIGVALYSSSAFSLSTFFLHNDFTVFTAASASPLTQGCFGLTRTCSRP